MSVSVKWDNDKQRVILWTFEGRWTWGEYDEARVAATAMIAQVPHEVDFLYDVRQISIIPPDIASRFKLRYLRRIEGSRLMIVVGADTELKLLWNTFTSLPYAKHLRAYFFDELADARRFIERYERSREQT